MKFKELIYKNFETLETIFLLVFTGGLMLLFQQVEYAKYIFASGTGALAIIYWFKAIEKNSESNNKKRYSQKFVWYSLMISPAAIYSKINMFEKSNMFLIFSIALILSALTIRIIQKINKKVTVPNEDIIRLVVATIINLSIFALPLPK